MTKFHLKIGNYLQTPFGKKYYNQKVFNEIAPRYDFITRALSFGQDENWKKELISLLPAIERPFCVDLACGTGDITRLLAEKYPQGRIVGVDIAEEMLWRAREHSRGHPVLFVNCDMSRLDLESESADIVTGGYALRNAPHLKQTIAEIHRVLKPGGVAAFLDFSRPEGRIMQKAEYALLKIWTGFWGLLFHRNAEVYGYIAESLRKFPDAGALDRLFYGQGFAILVSRFYFGGITRLLIVRKF